MESKRDRKQISFRINFLIVVFIIAAAAIVGKLGFVQIFQHDHYTALAANQHKTREEWIPERGEIFVGDRYSRELYPLATNQDLYFLYAVPNQIENPQETLDKLAPILDIEVEKKDPTDEEESTDQQSTPETLPPKSPEQIEAEKKKQEEYDQILKQISNADDPYEPIRRGLDKETANKIEELELAGLYLETEKWRYYPEGPMAAHILGFVGFDADGQKKVGQYGVEGHLNAELEGKSGLMEAKRDAAGRIIQLDVDMLEKVQDGDDVVLTIDRVIQHIVEEKLSQYVQNFQPDRASVIVMNPKTGALLALANQPTFDPNKYNEVEDVNQFLNTAIYEAYEPGSVFKPLVMAAGIDSGAVTPDTTYRDVGCRQVGGHKICNYANKSWGTQTMTQALAQSLNLGLMFVSEQLGTERLHSYLDKFGLTEITGIELDTESGSNIKNLEDWLEADLATASFGQGLAVTPLQLITAISTIANDGKLMQPHIIERYIHPDDTEEIIEPHEIRQAISPSAALTVGAMMVNAIENGVADTAHIEGYLLAGKTGTAQVPQAGGGYDPQKRNTSFAGFGPIEDPQFAILVRFDNPKIGNPLGATTAAPLFKDIAQEILEYYQIPPTQ